MQYLFISVMPNMTWYAGSSPSVFAPIILHWRSTLNIYSYNLSLLAGAPNENVVQNHLNIALLNVF